MKAWRCKTCGFWLAPATREMEAIFKKYHDQAQRIEVDRSTCASFELETVDTSELTAIKIPFSGTMVKGSQ